MTRSSHRLAERGHPAGPTSAGPTRTRRSSLGGPVDGGTVDQMKSFLGRTALSRVRADAPISTVPRRRQRARQDHPPPISWRRRGVLRTRPDPRSGVVHSSAGSPSTHGPARRDRRRPSNRAACFWSGRPARADITHHKARHGQGAIIRSVLDKTEAAWSPLVSRVVEAMPQAPKTIIVDRKFWCRCHGSPDLTATADRPGVPVTAAAREFPPSHE